MRLCRGCDCAVQQIPAGPDRSVPPERGGEEAVGWGLPTASRVERARRKRQCVGSVAIRAIGLHRNGTIGGLTDPKAASRHRVIALIAAESDIVAGSARAQAAVHLTLASV